MEKFVNKKVGLIGLGISNLYLANYLAKNNRVFVTEELNEDKLKDKLDKLDKFVEYECGGHTDKILESDIVIRSPGIPRHHSLIQKVLSKKIPVFTELEISFQIIKSKINKIPKIVAITGTNGKTTTTTLVGKILSSCYPDVIVAGNIGIPLINFVDRINEDTIIVLEVSSYQLEDIVEFKPYISCILNITEDHLEHHISMENYISAKTKIFINQTKKDFLILKYDDENINKIDFKKINPKIIFFSRNDLDEGCWWQKDSKKIIFKFKDYFEEFVVYPKIPGEHNIENILASVCCSVLLNVPKKNIEKTVSEFPGVEHRLEFVREIDGVIFVNDSKSTNVDSTLVALKSFDVPIHLILGGRDKKAPYTPLFDLIKEKVKTILLIGEATEIIYSQIKNLNVIIYKCKTLENAVLKAKEVAKKGEIVLLSPACASFDQFKNFEHRGQVFKEIVNRL
ncbi:MAG: UDP-N-acetylmuramoyl-L-alanine--D-glutamate ligase [Endomicrobiia bacterium]